MKLGYQRRVDHIENQLVSTLTKIDNFLIDNGDKTLKKCILDGLTASPKKLPCTLFYDDKGLELFEAITKLPEYYLTRTEIELLKTAAPQISDKLRNVDIVEFGSGDCIKISILLESVPKEFQVTIRYIPFDISYDAVKKSSNILVNKFPGIRIHGIVADFNSQLDVIPNGTKKVFCFLGSTIGNLSMQKAMQFLTNLSKIMHSNDILLIGFDMVKNKSILKNAYNDSKNVTEKFNKNILNVINNHIDTNFDLDSFEHIVFYNETLSRIEMHLKAIKDIIISSPTLAETIYIKKGETIHTENSYKFSQENIRTLASGSGLEIQKIFTDKHKWFSLVQLIKK